MKRRTLLSMAGVGAAIPSGGCLDEVNLRSRANNECGPGNSPLSSHIANESENTFDGDRAMHSLVIENERDSILNTTVGFEHDTAFSESYTIKPDDRALMRENVIVESEFVVTLQINNKEEYKAKWPERPCGRNAIAITPDGIETGVIEPIHGECYDPEHSCYVYDQPPIHVRSRAGHQTVKVQIKNLCTGAVSTHTVEIAGEEVERITGELLAGGIYEVTADVQDGGTRTYEFSEQCFGIAVSVFGESKVEFDEISII